MTEEDAIRLHVLDRLASGEPIYQEVGATGFDDLLSGRCKGRAATRIIRESDAGA